jgi:hypothetical protein
MQGNYNDASQDLNYMYVVYAADLPRTDVPLKHEGERDLNGKGSERHKS